MGKASRDKGVRGEAELARILRGHGFDSHRTAQHCGRSGDAADITLSGIHVEVKRTEQLSLYKAMAQAKSDNKKHKIPVVFHRRNNCEWLVVMTLEDWVGFYRESGLLDQEGGE